MRAGVSVGMVLVLCAAATRVALAEPATVGPDGALARSSPIEAATILRELPAGYRVCIVEEASAADPPPGEPRRWYMVRVSSQQYAFVRAGEVSPDAYSATGAAMCDPANAGARNVTGLAAAPGAAAAAASSTAAAAPAPRAASDAGGSPFRRRDPGVVGAGTFLPLDPLRFTLGLMSGAAWLNGAAADQHHVGRAGATFYVTVGMALYEVLSVSSAFGAAFPSDHASFEEDVVPLLGGGAPSTAHSSLQITNYSIAVGPRTPLVMLRPGPAGGLVGALFADYGWSRINGDRFIENCGNCRSENLELPNGKFWRVGTDVGLTALGASDVALMATLSYQRYFAGAGMSQELRLGFTIWFV